METTISISVIISNWFSPNLNKIFLRRFIILSTNKWKN